MSPFDRLRVTVTLSLSKRGSIEAATYFLKL
jgi:hypothetical protein